MLQHELGLAPMSALHFLASDLHILAIYLNPAASRSSGTWIRDRGVTCRGWGAPSLPSCPPCTMKRVTSSAWTPTRFFW